MRVWADIENDPQVQYLLPVVSACGRAGAETLVTARDYGSALELLESRGVEFRRVGAAYGSSKVAKVRGLVGRTRALTALLKANGGAPDRLVCASRAAVLAARRLGVSSFFISDYEHASLSVFRWAGSTVLFPDVIDPDVYRRAGFPPDRLRPFSGLKEELTFSGLDVDAIEPASFAGDPDPSLVRVLIRPPAEQSHYFAERSRQLYLDTLRHLARDERVVVVLSPRYPSQAAEFREQMFANEPVVLDRPLPFLSLLKAVDLVLCSGGTMLREAAYLGIPAYSIFGSEIAAVDRHLESVGRVTFVTSPEEFARIRLEKSVGLVPLSTNPRLVDEIADVVMAADPRGSAAIG